MIHLPDVGIAVTAVDWTAVVTAVGIGVGTTSFSALASAKSHQDYIKLCFWYNLSIALCSSFHALGSCIGS